MSTYLSVPCTSGDVQLFGSPVARAGIVRVCVNGLWDKVCGGESDPHLASIVCSQLGYSPYGMYQQVLAISCTIFL